MICGEPFRRSGFQCEVCCAELLLERTTASGDNQGYFAAASRGPADRNAATNDQGRYCRHNKAEAQVCVDRCTLHYPRRS
jgi:hypothetical protein